MTNRSVAFQFYPDKWQSHTKRLSDSAYRVYHELLCWMWQQSPDLCSVSDSVDAVVCAVAMPTDCVRSALAEIQNPHGPLLKVEGGKMISNGLRKEALKQADRRLKAVASANARYGHTNAAKEAANAVAKQCSSIPIPIPIPSSISIHKISVGVPTSCSESADASSAPDKYPKSIKRKKSVNLNHPTRRITFDPESMAFNGILDSDRALFAETFPAVDVAQSIVAARGWLISNPTKCKKNVYRFLMTWMARSQERGGARQSPYIPLERTAPEHKPLSMYELKSKQESLQREYDTWRNSSEEGRKSLRRVTVIKTDIAGVECKIRAFG